MVYIKHMDEDGSAEHKVIRLPATQGPRPFKCEVCQRSFRELATLRKHEQLHRADRPYVCTTCHKSFLWSSNLKVHERVHTGERPYKCKICHRCFTQSNDLRRHERNVHMRGKLMSYRSSNTRNNNNAPTTAGHVNLAAYQAFAMQQRALLQHALTYESIMQNAASVTQTHYLQNSQQAVPLQSMLTSSKHCDLASSTSTEQTMSRQLFPRSTPSPIKLEQVTPPSTPNGNHSSGNGSERPLSRQNSTASDSELRNLQRQMAGEFKLSLTSSSGVIHSPPALSSSSYLSQSRPLTSHSDGAPNRLMSPSPQNTLRITPEHSSATSLPQPVPLPPISSIYHGANHHGLNPHIDRDRVIDLSINKSVSSGDSDDGDWNGKEVNTSLMSKSPQISEAESEEKRDVTTTSETPTADSGIHHCPHCNIFFHDFTMYHLHQSLHSPLEEDPFKCPSCLKQCQDRIEFMFHIVWHVKYPHTIPNYQPFKESYLT